MEDKKLSDQLSLIFAGFNLLDVSHQPSAKFQKNLRKIISLVKKISLIEKKKKIPKPCFFVNQDFYKHLYKDL